MDYLRFNRHDLYTADDLRVIGDLMNARYSDNPIEINGDNLNALYGLYDGYLYPYMVQQMTTILEGVDDALLARFNALMVKTYSAIAMLQLTTGEQATTRV